MAACVHADAKPHKTVARRDPFAMLLAAAATIVLLAIVHFARRVRRWLLLARIPRLEQPKLTQEALAEAAGRAWPGGMVRLPGEHGVLVTDPSLASRLLKRNDGAMCRDITMYTRYSGFLGGALVLQPQATKPHRMLRAALLPLFSATATRASHAALLACTEKLCSRLAAHVARKGSDEPAPLYRLLQEYVLDITGCAFLAQELSDADCRRLIAIFEEWLHVAPPPSPATSSQRVKERVRRWWARSAPEEDDRLRRTFAAMLSRMCEKQAAATSAALAATQTGGDGGGGDGDGGDGDGGDGDGDGGRGDGGDGGGVGGEGGVGGDGADGGEGGGEGGAGGDGGGGGNGGGDGDEG